MLMISNLLIQIYCLPLSYIIVFMILSFFVWTFLGIIFNIANKKSVWKIINVIMAFFFVALILYTTVLNRSGGSQVDIQLMPFNSFIEAKEEVEMYRTMLMNVFLFFPFGLTLVNLFPQKVKHNIILTIMIAMTFSIAIETCQYIFKLGRVETDDVICNTFGALVGALSYLIIKFFAKRFKIKCIV